MTHALLGGVGALYTKEGWAGSGAHLVLSFCGALDLVRAHIVRGCESLLKCSCCC